MCSYVVKRSRTALTRHYVAITLLYRVFRACCSNANEDRLINGKKIYRRYTVYTVDFRNRKITHKSDEITLNGALKYNIYGV